MITLRPHQIAACDAVEQAFRDGTNRPLVDACVASGKSLIFAELARRAWERGERSLILAHTRELVTQNAVACASLGLRVGINAAALGERVWRAPVISASIQSVYKSPGAFGPIGLLQIDEAHMCPPSEAGMYRQLIRGLGPVRVAGASGTVFRLQGGSLVEGEAAPFDRVVFTYSILDGIRDGYLCPAFSLGATDKVDTTKLRVRQGEYTADSSDAQMIAAMDNHIAQMVHHGTERRAWLVFEAGVKSATAMAQRMGEWGIPTGLVLGKTKDDERAALIEAFRAGRLRALVNIQALTTGFDVPGVDLLVMRRRTKSLGLYIQMVGRLLRTVGGNITESVRQGKPDGGVLDFAGNIDEHGPLDFIRHKDTKAKLVSCGACGIRNAAAARRCWSCDEPLMKLCTACLCDVPKGTLDCPHCGYDMRPPEPVARGAPVLLATPSGAALIASWGKSAERAGGWLPIAKIWNDGHVDMPGGRVRMPDALAAATRGRAPRWLRQSPTGEVVAVLVPNGASRTSARQISADGSEIIVPMPAGQ